MSDCIIGEIPYDPEELLSRPIPLWEVTQSAIEMFQTCRQKFVFRYLMQLKKDSINLPQIVGTAVHSGFEVLLSPTPPKKNKKLVDRVQGAMQAASAVFDKVEERADLMATLDAKAWMKSRAQANAILETWNIINGSNVADWDIHSLEQTVRALPRGQAETIYDRMAGKLDIDLTLSGHGDQDGRYILDHKTKGTLYRMNTYSGVILDPQFRFYAVMLKYRASLQQKNMRETRGFILDAIARPLHRTGDTVEELQKRMVTAMLEAPDRYFMLETLPFDNNSISQAYQNLAAVINEMDALGNSVAVTMNTRACTAYGGCEYLPLCREGAQAGDPSSVLKLPILAYYSFTAPHQELAADGEED